MTSRELREPDFGVLLLVCWAVAVAQLLAMDLAVAARTMSDTDDALRLVQMRSFLAGQGWFDLHEARLGPPTGYDSHWSRLVDAGLAGLFLIFRAFTDTARAEFLMRIVWPLLWLLPAICAVAALAWRIAGREAALVTLLLVAVGMPAFQQFKPGRIDHHNVQIALALLALAAAAWGDRARWALAGGAVTGLALAVGLEGILFLVVAGAAPALRWCVDRTSAPALRAYGLAVAGATLAGFLVSVGPDHWGRAACDTMAVNWMAPVVVAGLMLAAAATVFANAGPALRCGAVTAIVVAAAAVFVSLEPRCLGGPFALIDPQLRPVWLGHVQEMQPLLQILRNELPAGAAILAFPLATLVATLWLAREPQMRANAGFLVTATAALCGIALTLAAAKGYNYAVWMGMPLVAALALRVFVRFKLTSLAAQVFVGIMLTPAVLSSGAMALAQTTGAKELTDSARVGRGCFDSKSYAELARLPVGVVASDVDYGPFVLALTPHSALGGPYHRLGAGILAAHKVLALPPAEARQVIAAHDVRYLVTCGTAPPAGLSRAERETGLWGRLAAGELPDWIEQRPDDQGPVFTVYRVKPDAGGGR